jgi:acyl carrier protein
LVIYDQIKVIISKLFGNRDIIMANKLYEIISKVMNIPTLSLNDTMGPESIENWTSFNGYVLLHELETGFDVKFTIDEAMDVTTIADIKRHLKNKGIIFD